MEIAKAIFRRKCVFDEEQGRTMKIGIISDIHSNYRAFKACLDFFEKEKADYYLLLGDYVSDTPHPEKVMEMIYSLREKHKVFMIRGNREDYFLEDRAEDKGWTKCSAVGNLLYTKEKLTEEDFQFFEQLPICETLSIDGYPSITYCHGSPESTREHIYMDTENSDRWLEQIETDYLICGHTHQRCIYLYKEKTYINTGSCGIPIHNATMAECVMLTGVIRGGKNDWDINLISIPYDSQSLIEEIYTSGLYDYAHWFMNTNIQTLTCGIDRAACVVEEAYRIKNDEKDTGEGERVGTFPTEEHFRKAARKLNVPDYANNRNPVVIRMALPEDAEALLGIYSHYVENTAVTFEVETPSIEEFQERIRNTRKAFPYYVAQKDGKILGYAYASKFRTRAAYGWNSEFSVYVDKNAHRMGIGSLLLETVEETLIRQGIVNLYAIISDTPEESPYIPKESISFHKKNGFEEEGRLSKVGVKFGKWFDTVYMVKRLGECKDNPSKPQPYFIEQ